MGKEPSRKPTVSPEEAFGLVLRAARNKAGISQEVLAAKGGYSRNYISELERGCKSPSLRTLVNLSTVLNTRPSVMLKRVEDLIGHVVNETPVEPSDISDSKRIHRKSK